MEEDVDVLADEESIDWREELWNETRWDYLAEELLAGSVYGTLL